MFAGSHTEHHWWCSNYFWLLCYTIGTPKGMLAIILCKFALSMWGSCVFKKRPKGMAHQPWKRTFTSFGWWGSPTKISFRQKTANFLLGPHSTRYLHFGFGEFTPNRRIFYHFKVPDFGKLVCWSWSRFAQIPTPKIQKWSDFWSGFNGQMWREILQIYFRF
jgi:hypothetical protein